MRLHGLAATPSWARSCARDARPISRKTISKAQRAAYEQGIKRCNTKYRNEDGTMYRSFEAFCRAELAVKTAAKLGNGKK